MKIYNNIDGQARLVENIADGVNTDDAASGGQVNASSYSPVRYSASRYNQILAVSYGTGVTGTATYYLTRAQLLESEYASGCTNNTSGTNLVTVPSGVYLVIFNLNSYTDNHYLYDYGVLIGIRINSNVGFADGVGSLYARFRYVKPVSVDHTVNKYIPITTSRIVNVASSAVLGFSAYFQVQRANETTYTWYIYSSNYSVVKI